MILKWSGCRGEQPRQPTSPGDADPAQFDLTVGREYRCHAVAVFNGSVFALICDDTSLPWWYRMEQFTVTDGSISPSWKLGLHDRKYEGLQMVTGYPAIATDIDHYVGVIERIPEEMEVFWRQTGIAGLVDQEFDAVVIEILPSGCRVRLENEEIGFLPNTKNQSWVDGDNTLAVNDSLRIVIVDAIQYPVGVSTLVLDIDAARRGEKA
ncbi:MULTISPECIES: hypothetical protein [Actinomadura]|uniref:S1 motif domain-containing protein n=1 Tax=Actinomadura yumaensis TaxID=111807 RepID=A0ABW2CQB5_9ACTN|nr:hypothetical protein [Actinomadura sp. J1-007]MWK34288.1 hypothetical protein [Actinomadura sp. J1-007]